MSKYILNMKQKEFAWNELEMFGLWDDEPFNQFEYWQGYEWYLARNDEPLTAFPYTLMVNGEQYDRVSESFYYSLQNIDSDIVKVSQSSTSRLNEVEL